MRAGGSGDPRGGTHGRACVAKALQLRMWRKLHLLNKTLYFSSLSRSHWCGGSPELLRAGSVGAAALAAQTMLWDGQTKVKLPHGWPPSPYSSTWLQSSWVPPPPTAEGQAGLGQ